MSSVVVKPRATRTPEFDWARLIPGEVGDVGIDSKRKPQPVREGFDAVARGHTKHHESAWAELTPKPLHGRTAWMWLHSAVMDWALIVMNWLVLGAVLLPLRASFPEIAPLGCAAGAPVVLIGVAMLQAALITLVGYTEGLHLPAANLRIQARMVAKSVFLGTLVLCGAYMLQGVPSILVGLVCIAGGLHFGALWAWRWRFRERERASIWGQRNVLIVGANPVGKRIACCLRQNPAGGRRFCGFLDNENADCDVIGEISDLARLARQRFADEIILAAPRRSDLTRHVLNEARHLRLDVELVPDLFGWAPADPEIETVGGMPLICLHAERLPAVGLFLKRILDVAVSATVLAVLALLFGAIALLVKIESPGPVFYRAPRAGRKARPFLCYKFRTMVSNAEHLRAQLRHRNERNGPIFKIADDPRITRVGRYLRRYSLDELPQLWNVLKGEMSLVGPRPHLVDEYTAYEMRDLARLDATPGITGLWQVTARRDPSFDRAMELDREYIRSWNLGLDFRILLKTVLAVAQGSGQ